MSFLGGGPHHGPAKAGHYVRLTKAGLDLQLTKLRVSLRRSLFMQCLMNENERPDALDTISSAAEPLAQKEPWQRPTLESLDVADTEAMPGLGLDGGGCSLS